MRYFIQLAYDGGPFQGWQIQHQGQTVQGAIESTMARILREDIKIAGCGRTDTGVHARLFYAHFDFDQPLPEHFIHRLNQLLPPAIAIYDLFPVTAEDHARYSAVRRTYHYHLIDRKDPFLYNQRYHFYGFHQLQTSEMQAAAMMLMDYDAFYPFCKAHSGVKHYRCDLQHAAWSFTPHEMIFEITANRFLRGMVRLIVGMCIQVGMGKMAVDHVREALEQQSPLSGSWSVPPEGLFLTDIQYPFLTTQE